LCARHPADLRPRGARAPSRIEKRAISSREARPRAPLTRAVDRASARRHVACWRAGVPAPLLRSPRSRGAALALLLLFAAACAQTSPVDDAADGAAVGPAPVPLPVPDAGGPARDAAAPDARADDDAADAADARDAAPRPPFACLSDGTFPALVQLPEASSATEVELTPGTRELLVLSDSGRNGEARLFALPSGAQRTITLPLDTATASDDVEGIAWRAGKLYTLTSSGAVRRFTPDGSKGIARDQDAYRLGADPVSCPDLTTVNCGRNYEGLCLRAAGLAHPCAGYAASKADGKLYCLDLDGAGRLVVKAGVAPLALGLPADQLSDCAFGAAGGAGEGALVVTTNVNGGSKAYRVDEATGTLTALAIKIAVPSNVEAIALDRDGSLYVFDDNSFGVSSAAKMTCVGW
jgi:hypothetical protein